MRVHSLVSEKTWSKRYKQINNFERTLVEEGTTILKFFLHIDKEEQKSRLQARLDEPDKNWKFSMGDLDERKLWPDYINAYQDVLSKTSTDWAPWIIVPANRKWYRNLVITKIMVDALQGLDMRYPASQADLSGVVID